MCIKYFLMPLTLTLQLMRWKKWNIFSSSGISLIIASVKQPWKLTPFCLALIFKFMDRINRKETFKTNFFYFRDWSSYPPSLCWLRTTISSVPRRRRVHQKSLPAPLSLTLWDRKWRPDVTDTLTVTSPLLLIN